MRSPFHFVVRFLHCRWNIRSRRSPLCRRARVRACLFSKKDGPSMLYKPSQRRPLFLFSLLFTSPRVTSIDSSCDPRRTLAPYSIPSFLFPPFTALLHVSSLRKVRQVLPRVPICTYTYTKYIALSIKTSKLPFPCLHFSTSDPSSLH